MISGDKVTIYFAYFCIRLYSFQYAV